ncbi:MAG: hypothetical protein WC774_03460 [Candidatus Gracilibacteria bacterium]
MCTSDVGYTGGENSIIEDIENVAISRDIIKEELLVLNGELLKTGDLTTRLFSMQYFDTRSVELFKERIQITTLIKRECEIYARMYEDTTFVDLIDANIGFIKLDKIQFHQVLINLLQNAIKFLDKKESIIIIEAYYSRWILSYEYRRFIGSIFYRK